MAEPALDPRFAELMRTVFARQAFMGLIGCELVSAAPGQCVLAVAMRPELTQQNGVFHGGVIGALADNAGGGAAATTVEPGFGTVTVEYKINFLAPAAGQRLIARAQVIRPGKRMVVAESRVFAERDEKENLCAISIGTFAPFDLRPRA